MVKLIIDTSVWIDYFSGQLAVALRQKLLSALDTEQVAITDVILNEILVGAVNKRDYDNLKDMFSSLVCLRIDDDQIDDFNHFAWNLRKKGLGGKYTDVSIAYLAHANNYPVFSLDTYFAKLAGKGLIETI